MTINLRNITKITADSRQVIPGALFVALSGSKTDGSQYIDQAISNGARVIISQTLPEKRVADIEYIVEDNPRLVLTQLAARFYPEQPENIVAVTGTNGKTSIAHFCRMIWQQMGFESASLGTLGIVERERYRSSLNGMSLTTPDPVTLHQYIQELTEHGVSHLAVEASSHGIDQYRLDGLKIKAAAFTNLSRDHLDYHHTLEAYFEAKMQLFARIMPEGGVAVINNDSEYYEEVAAICRKRLHRIISYGKNPGELQLLHTIPSAEGQTIIFNADGIEHKIKVKLVGDFQASNLLAALGLVIGAGGNKPRAIDALATLPPVPGRMEHVENPNTQGQIFVDYAHTPDALEKALLALRPHTEKRLIVVFGCGGDRDKGKRPQMGELAAKLADYTIVTDDNPRSEDPEVIRSEVMAGCPKAENIGDRRAAIAKAIAMMGQGDVLLIAGKGHEKTQTIGKEVIAFDDVMVAAS